jgi:hypothetical protein
MSITGHCHCGKVRYEIALDVLKDIAICHCTACRRSTGGTHVTWVTVPRASFRWTGDSPREYPSSDHAARFFCPACGAQLAFQSTKEPESIDITITTTDDPDRHAPDRHVWAGSKLAWVHVDDGLRVEAREHIRPAGDRP